MPSRMRMGALAVHVALSVGWVGALAAYLALDVAAATSRDVAVLRAAYLAMEVVAVSVIVPLAVASLVTGLAMSLGTQWGLMRHYWVVISLLLTVVATVVLLLVVLMLNVAKPRGLTRYGWRKQQQRTTRTT